MGRVQWYIGGHHAQSHSLCLENNDTRSTSHSSRQPYSKSWKFQKYLSRTSLYGAEVDSPLQGSHPLATPNSSHVRRNSEIRKGINEEIRPSLGKLILVTDSKQEIWMRSSRFWGKARTPITHQTRWRKSFFERGNQWPKESATNYFWWWIPRAAKTF